MIHVVLGGICLLALIIFLEYGPTYGIHKSTFFTDVLNKWKGEPITKWHEIYKGQLNKLSKTSFANMKMKGTRAAKRSNLKASRGYDKLMEILMVTKMKLYGRVLSLCCGPGGWEQAIAPNPDIDSITSITFGAGPGHEGHRNFTTKVFPGLSKVKLIYGDVRLFPETEHDVLLFDGGESRTNSEKEARQFKQLFMQSVMRQIKPTTREFVLKILVPSDPELIECMKMIQKITGKGCLMRSSHSRASTLECYFVSMPIVKVEDSVKMCLKDIMERGEQDVKLATRDYGPGYDYYREEVESEILPPLDMSDSIHQCGESVPAEPRAYNHWEAKGIYPVGNKGSAGMKYNGIATSLLRLLIPTLPGFDKWRLTDTTPSGFIEVFRRKIDVAPVENHSYITHMEKIYAGMADYFKKRGFVYKQMSDDEILNEANKQGAPGFQDVNHKNVGKFLEDPNWRKIVAKHERALMNGKPIGGVFNTMGKREKKRMKRATIGSRMIAYLPIPMRILELKAFGCLLQLTKPGLNRFGVGGLGLHDLGMRIHEVWKGFVKPASCSTDIAAFDTRVGAVVQRMECRFIQSLGGGKLVERFYQLYSHPMIMIPIPSEYMRSQLLQGRGQRMSGSQTTYSMNTITRIMLMILQSAKAKKRLDDVEVFTREMMEGKHYGACVSGDDEQTCGEFEDVDALNQNAGLLHEVGFPRKDMSAKDVGTLSTTIEEIDFCSHHYVPVSYFDSETGRKVVRWAPTRDMTEIAAKSVIRLGTGDQLSDEAWLSAQGNNLLVNYHHMRTAKAMGLAFKAVVNPNLLLTDKGGFIKPTPWMRSGDILEVINDVLFGSSTAYPTPGFRVRSYSHLGYMGPKTEILFDPDFHDPERQKWRRTLHYEAERTVLDKHTGGDVSILDNWRARDLY